MMKATKIVDVVLTSFLERLYTNLTLGLCGGGGSLERRERSMSKTPSQAGQDSTSEEFVYGHSYL